MTEFIMNTDEMSKHLLESFYWQDNEQIVRCIDCEFGAYGGEECMRIDERDGELWFPVEPDGFCKWGERKVVE